MMVRSSVLLAKDGARARVRRMHANLHAAARLRYLNPYNLCTL